MVTKQIKTGIKDKPVLCYIGDLPDRRVDGITQTFEYNLSILSEFFTVRNIPENSSLYSSPLSRMITIASFWRSSNSTLKKMNPEVVYINLPTSTLGLLKIYLIAIFANKLNSNVLFHLHRGDLTSKIKSSKIYLSLFRRILKKADKIVVLSEKECSYLNSHFATSAFTHLSNTVNASCTNVNPFQNRSGFLFISNYLESKGIFDLLEVFSLMTFKNEKIFCYGSFSSAVIKAKLLTFSSNHISINGPIKGSKKHFALQKARCLILPSWNEGQPLVILEAMCQGLPVIASDVGFVREMLGNDYPFLYPAKNKNALKMMIQEVIDHKTLESVGNQLKKRFDEIFNPENHRKALIETFKPYIN